MGKTIVIRDALPEESEIVINIFKAAFDTDPVMNWLLRQDSKRDQAFETIFRISVEQFGFKAGHIYISDDGGAALLWVPHPHWKISIASYLFKLGQLRNMFSLYGLPHAITFFRQQEHFHPQTPHDYVMWLGVKPDLQRQGYGTALMNHYLRQCDDKKHACYLELMQMKNKVFYQKFGFHYIHEIPIGSSAPPYAGMWRE